MTLRVRFWGTRGSIPAPGADTVRYGGNTPCVEVTTNTGWLIILDAGTGMRALDQRLTERPHAGAGVENDQPSGVRRDFDARRVAAVANRVGPRGRNRSARTPEAHTQRHELHTSLGTLLERRTIGN